MAFYEEQRAGKKPGDSANIPQVWGWKQPGYTNICSTYQKSLTAAQRAGLNLGTNAGYFEAGTAVVVTSISAFVAAQQALGLLMFEGNLNRSPNTLVTPDSAKCLPSTYRKPVMMNVRRQMRCAQGAKRLHKYCCRCCALAKHLGSPCTCRASKPTRLID